MFERAKEIFQKVTRRDTDRRQAHELYVDIAEAARRPEFFRDLDVPDTVEGRYELLSLHTILVLRRLKAAKAETAGFAQLLFDVMFRDVDDTLREMGVGDMRIGKKVREYAEAFFGRALAYETALAGEGSLEDALSRNVYEAHAHPMATALASYVRHADEKLSNVPVAELRAGHVTFPEIEAAGAAAAG